MCHVCRIQAEDLAAATTHDLYKHVSACRSPGGAAAEPVGPCALAAEDFSKQIEIEFEKWEEIRFGNINPE